MEAEESDDESTVSGREGREQAIYRARGKRASFWKV